MGDTVQVVSLTEEQRAAADRQRQALEAARLAAEAQVQREQEERRRREEEAQRQRNLAAQRAAQVRAASSPLLISFPVHISVSSVVGSWTGHLCLTMHQEQSSCMSFDTAPQL